MGLRSIELLSQSFLAIQHLKPLKNFVRLLTVLRLRFGHESMLEPTKLLH